MIYRNNRWFTKVELLENSKRLTRKGKDWMKNFLNNIPDQVSRLVLVFAALIIFVLIIKTWIIPPELKETGIYRTSAIETELAKPVHYAGSGNCADCHNDISEVKSSGYHYSLSCESCHGPGMEHSEDPEEITPSAPRKREFCSHCHTYNLSRPSGFPQINPIAHNPLDACIECHDPHNPEPPEVPQECSACHTQIARTKSFSSHVKLDCIDCHNAPEEHKINPRLIKPTKPITRKFCGQCHSKNSSYRGTLKINMVTHGENYLCWQCHYPHMPEVK